MNKEFKVPKQAQVDIESELGSPSTLDRDVSSEFTVPTQAVKEIGRIAGESSPAAEVLEGEEENTEPTEARPPSTAAEWERQRANRNFSFIDGQTRFVFDELSYPAKLKAISLRQKMLERLDSRQVDERGIGLLRVTSKDHYLTYLGDPPQNVPVIHFEPSGRIMTHHTPFQSECAYIRYFGRKHRIVNLYDIPEIDPVILNRSMGKGVDYWEKLLPDLSEIDKMRSGTSWRSWVPTIKL